MTSPELEKLRFEINKVNAELLRLLARRGTLVEEIGRLKQTKRIDMYDPVREAEQLGAIVEQNPGPFSDATIKHLFTEIFRASLDLMYGNREKGLRVSRAFRREDTVFEVGGVTIGGEAQLIAGPCSVESEDQLMRTAAHVASRGVRLLRGGAHKPRTSPYSFQGIGDEGYRWMAKAAKTYGMVSVSEVMDEAGVAAAAPHIDILQIGARNMANFRLLEAVREVGKPVLLKRGIAATYEELLFAAEYLIAGTDKIILCERGIRTFETWTRNTLDIAAVPILRGASHLPVCVDVSHAAGRKDILAPLARAALASGANLVMCEVHPAPDFALSDSHQQLDFDQFDDLCREIAALCPACCDSGKIT
ncbi:MAG: bifunctional 3-deoxy-7-phosphoheptulonate synthase/chorismate mutase [Candidatus Lernaella stagnicola]|nr:bifunctional 3-deoxy-7-phosphoheptulonate synthase/chorismate mutase [Candidatus Lernaella stagnicola]